MKVYVITKGEYSDYMICDVTLDKEHAKKIATDIYMKWLAEQNDL